MGAPVLSSTSQGSGREVGQIGHTGHSETRTARAMLWPSGLSKGSDGKITAQSLFGDWWSPDPLRGKRLATPPAEVLAEVEDAIGRVWQLGTIQLDFNLPERFELEYTGEDNLKHRPFMIHRALFGSIERFFGVLIEHYAGAFPLWLAPEQGRVVTVSDKFTEYGQKVEKELKAHGFRVNGDYRPEKIGFKIREAQLDKIPYMLVFFPYREFYP